MSQLSIMSPDGKLPNGQTVNVGDVVLVNYWGYQGFRKIFDSNGHLALIGAGARHFVEPIHQFIHFHGDVRKVTPKEAYLFCKERGEQTEPVLLLFQHNDLRQPEYKYTNK